MAARQTERDYYATLGVAGTATEDEIRRAYRRLALQWHPDRNPDDPQAEERFKQISEAYAVLMDGAKRRAYDGARGAGTPADFGSSREDLFRDLFADPRASAIFEELARELGRMGMRVERQDFERTLFGGRVVVTGGVFVVSPLTPARLLWRLGRTALRASQASAERRPVTERARTTPALPSPGGVLGRAWQGARRLLRWAPSPTGLQDGDVTFPLRLTPSEAGQGTRKRVTLRRTDGDDDVVVITIPAGTRAGARLRLRGKGRSRPDGARGDAYLVVELAAGE